MKAQVLVLIPIVLLLVISVSGCTSIPGLDSIPFLSSFCIPGFTCASVVQYENDVLVISTLDAIPSTISTGQQFRLSAWIENRGAETVPQTGYDSSINFAEIKLYDTCEGLFKNPIKVTCPNEQEKDGTDCKIKSILPKQKIPVFWTLTAYEKDKIPLETSCNLKVYVKYPYKTKSITSISFVDYTEYQRMLNENKFTPITSYITEGYGPIKPYLTVEDQQPIPVKSGPDSTTTMAFQIKNQGSGFLDRYLLSGGNQDKPVAEISPTGKYPGDNINEKIKTFKAKDLILIGKESPKQHFTISTPSQNKVEKIATYYVTTTIDYMYEFRKEIKVTIKPPAITS